MLQMMIWKRFSDGRKHDLKSVFTVNTSWRAKPSSSLLQLERNDFSSTCLSQPASQTSVRVFRQRGRKLKNESQQGVQHSLRRCRCRRKRKRQKRSPYIDSHSSLSLYCYPYLQRQIYVGESMCPPMVSFAFSLSRSCLSYYKETSDERSFLAHLPPLAQGDVERRRQQSKERRNANERKKISTPHDLQDVESRLKRERREEKRRRRAGGLSID